MSGGRDVADGNRQKELRPLQVLDSRTLLLLRLVALNRTSRLPAPVRLVINLILSVLALFGRHGGPADPAVRLRCDELRPGRLNRIDRVVRCRVRVDANRRGRPVRLWMIWAGMVTTVQRIAFEALPQSPRSGVSPRDGDFILEFTSAGGLKVLGFEVEYPSGETVWMGHFVAFSPLGAPAAPGPSDEYADWRREYDLREPALDRIEALDDPPVVSVIVPVYDTDPNALECAIESVRAQSYPHWQLCLANDASSAPHVARTLARYAAMDTRIRVATRERRGGIAAATNSALALANGPLTAFLDHDDALTPDALWVVVSAWLETGFDVCYSDEDKLVDGRRAVPFFKPAYSPERLLAQNYICHFLVVRSELLRSVGGPRSEFDGSQDHDLILRLLDHTDRVVHLPRVLYHWRAAASSTASDASAKPEAWGRGLEAVRAALVRRGVEATVSFGMISGSYTVRRRVLGNPSASVLIPFRDRAEDTVRCVRSILERSSFSGFEILLIDNGSREPATAEAVAQLVALDGRIRLVAADFPFNYSRLNNLGASQARGDFLIFLNNDTVVISPDWIEALLEHAQLQEVGVVGAKLLFPDDTVQHAGVVIGMGGCAAHAMALADHQAPGWFGELCVARNVSAVTGACMATRRALFLEIGGFNEEDLPVAFNDVDLCLRLLELGYTNIFTPHCRLYHLESASRGRDDTTEKLARAVREIEYVRSRHARILQSGDPYYNPNLTLARPDCSLGTPRFDSRLPRMAPRRGHEPSDRGLGA